jgi:hypothetical protein
MQNGSFSEVTPVSQENKWNTGFQLLSRVKFTEPFDTRASQLTPYI